MQRLTIVAVTAASWCACSGMAQDQVLLDTGLINDQVVDQVTDTIRVRPAEAVMGVVDVDVFNEQDPGAVTPIGAMVTWGERETAFWPVATNAVPGWSTHTVPIDVIAPLEPGEYYLMIAIAPRFTAAQVMSATSAPCSPAIWDDGNDLGWNWSRKEFRESRDYGFTSVLTRDASCSGFEIQTRGVTWLRIVVECPADLSGDGHVGLSDLSIVLAEFGKTCDGGEGLLVRWDDHPDGETHWYEVVLQTGTWTDARASAERRSYQDIQGHLATITSQAENETLFALIEPLANQQGDFWIGGHQPNDEACEIDTGWEWVNAEPWAYANWSPSVYAGDGCESYAQLGHAGAWGDRDDGDLRDNFGYVVEYSR